MDMTALELMEHRTSLTLFYSRKVMLTLWLGDIGNLSHCAIISACLRCDERDHRPVHIGA